MTLCSFKKCVEILNIYVDTCIVFIAYKIDDDIFSSVLFLLFLLWSTMIFFCVGRANFRTIHKMEIAMICRLFEILDELNNKTSIRHRIFAVTALSWKCHNPLSFPPNVVPLRWIYFQLLKWHWYTQWEIVFFTVKFHIWKYERCNKKVRTISLKNKCQSFRWIQTRIQIDNRYLQYLTQISSIVKRKHNRNHLC